MVFKRNYTRGYEGRVFDMFNWKKVDVLIKNWETDEVLYEGHDLEFPEDYSQSACDIIAKMYFRKNGVPCDSQQETSMKQVANRMVKFWMDSALDEGIIYQAEYGLIYDELLYMLLNQMWAPNSPQWFNTGLADAYGIKGKSSGHYYWDPELNKAVVAEDSYTRSQASACFICNVEDSLTGEQSLMDNLNTATRLFKYGSGIGINWSKVRGEGEMLSGGGTSSGVLSFMNVFDRNAGAIKSGGSSRRAAVMGVLNIDHPDIEAFIEWKSKEEKKVRALGKMGYNTNIGNEAYETVGGQNVNNSVSVTNEFMYLLDADRSDFELKGRVDDSINKTVKATELWDKLAQAAWECGDPGIHYTDTMNQWHTCPNAGRINGSNPCSEYLFLDDTSCNLASINLMKFRDENGDFNQLLFVEAVQLIQLVLEATIHRGYFPTAQIAENTYKFRSTGLGYTNLGSLLMCNGLPYDSEKARNMAATICSIMTAASYITSAFMAKRVGAFPEYENNKDAMLNVIKMHRTEAIKVFSKFDPLVHKLWDMALEGGTNHGFRNAQVTVLAPTGTIAFAMDCASTSSEPFFAHIIWKKLADGGMMQLVNPYVEDALRKIGITSEDHITEIKDYMMSHSGSIEGAPYVSEKDYELFDTANRCGNGTRYIDPMGHVKMVAALTPWLSGGISKTVNLPADATVDDIKEIYFDAWLLGCKCIAVYRDGCKMMQPLNTTAEEVSSPDDLEKLNYNELLKYAMDLQETLNSQSEASHDTEMVWKLGTKFRWKDCQECENILNEVSDELKDLTMREAAVNEELNEVLYAWKDFTPYRYQGDKDRVLFMLTPAVPKGYKEWEEFIKDLDDSRILINLRDRRTAFSSIKIVDTEEGQRIMARITDPAALRQIGYELVDKRVSINHDKLVRELQEKPGDLDGDQLLTIIRTIGRDIGCRPSIIGKSAVTLFPNLEEFNRITKPAREADERMERAMYPGQQPDTDNRSLCAKLIETANSLSKEELASLAGVEQNQPIQHIKVKRTGNIARVSKEDMQQAFDMVDKFDYATMYTRDIPVREILPNSPNSEKCRVSMGGHNFHINTSYYDDGRIGEIFASIGKQGSTTKGLMEVLCILISKVLQYGVPADVISDILRGHEFEPRGMVKGHDNIKSAASIPDLLSKIIDISSGDYTYCQVKPEPKMKTSKEIFEDFDPMLQQEMLSSKILIGTEKFPTVEDYMNHYKVDFIPNNHMTINLNHKQVAKLKEQLNNIEVTENDSIKITADDTSNIQYLSDTCPQCKSTKMINAGTCKYCTLCGSSSGCS